MLKKPASKDAGFFSIFIFSVEKLLYIPVGGHDQHSFPVGKYMAAAGERRDNAVLLGSQDVDVVLFPQFVI